MYNIAFSSEKVISIRREICTDQALKTVLNNFQWILMWEDNEGWTIIFFFYFFLLEEVLWIVVFLPEVTI